MERMNKKKKTGLIVLAIMLLMPMLGGMVVTPQADVSDVGLNPVKDFGLSANPTVSNAPIVTNPTTTDNLYGGAYTTYYITANITNAVSIQDVGAITITLNSSTTIVAGVQYSNVTALWTEHATGSSLITATATNTTDANDMNITVTFTIDWTFPDTDDMYIYLKIYNATGSGTVASQSAGTYDVDTDLTLTSTSLFVDANVQENDVLRLNTMIYSYEDSGAAVFPLAAQTDFYITRSAGTGSDIYPDDSFVSISYAESTGIATWDNPSATSTGNEHTETWTILAVTQGGGSSGTTLMGATKTDTIIINSASGGGGDDTSVEPILEDKGLLMVVVVLGGAIAVFVLFDGFGSKGKGKGSKKPKKKNKKRKSKPKKRKKR